jgi:hypothetical protein
MITIDLSSTAWQDYLFLQKDILTKLDQLAQIQAAAGGLSMGNRATETFMMLAKLKNYHKVLEASSKEQDNEQSR